MSEKKQNNKKSAVSAIVATVIVAVAAVAAIVVLFTMNKKPTAKLPDGTSTSFKPSQELVDECGAKAQELISDNYRIVRLFITEGLPYEEEPYGNLPEDGAYTVDSKEYKTYEQMEQFVKSVFVEDEANRILTQMPSDPATYFAKNSDSSSQSASSGETTVSSSVSSGSTSGNTTSSGNTSNKPAPELISVYTSRVAYVDVQTETSEESKPQVPDVLVPTESGESDTESSEDNSSETSKPTSLTYQKTNVLGISEYFKPYTAYNKPWNSISIKIVPTSEEECYVTVYLGADKDVNLSSVEDSDILNTKMIKQNGEWRLTELVY